MWYEVVLEPDDNGTWLVTAPAFPEVVSFGEAQEDACRNARNAIEEAIARRIAHGEDIPAPLDKTTGRGWFVEMSALVLLKSALYMIMREKGWTRADLMRALDCKREHVDRLFRLEHNSRLDSLEDAFRALGHPLRFDMKFPNAA
ncbi:type II toxin-antitoxin system HicB family antitoxin [Pelagibacterium xiamenense]|uniref:type II toxin-antitoxin system HicB family antitoxin n=1 Tax=Pelagibacterium xiamenense TaxID=2901140 RepID=UPI001E4D9172|nr:type II toxin-antitoxin system HicB family antitoxin [Pelagibacterium xiamenense]MCD7059483.1 type II toxin-antitoxin system HicB family antitoxin [Pelagibacterium xiamenense]